MPSRLDSGCLGSLRSCGRPIAMGAIAAIPLLFLPGYPESSPAAATQDDLNSYLLTTFKVLILSTAIAVVLGSITTSITYRLGAQFIRGEPPQPFPMGWLGLAWRFLLQGLALLLLAFGGLVVAVILGVVLQAVVGVPLAIIIVGIGVFIVYVGVTARLAIAPVILLSGAGPLESIQRAWRVTHGHWGQVLRWLIVSGLLVGIVAVVVNALVGVVLGAIGFRALSPIVGAAIGAPFTLIAAIVWIELADLLAGTSDATDPEAVLPVTSSSMPDAADA